MNERMNQNPWEHIDLARAALSGNDAVGRVLAGAFEPANVKHQDTLLALTSHERREVFRIGIRGNWQQHGVVSRASTFAATLARTGRSSEAWMLFDDLTSVRGVPAEVHEASLIALRNAGPEALTQPERVRRNVVCAMRLAQAHPSIFHHAVALLAALGERENSLSQLRLAARYGYELKLLQNDPSAPLASLSPDADAIIGLAQSDRGTLKLIELLRIEPNPAGSAVPMAGRVAKRALLLTAIAWRASLPNTQPLCLPDFLQKAEEKKATLLEWLEPRVVQEAEPEEWAYLIAPLHASQSAEDVELSWAVEAAAVLGWGLGQSPLPFGLDKVDPTDIIMRFGLGTPEGDAFLNEALLRPYDDLWRFRCQILSIDWRVTEALVRPSHIDLAALSVGNDFLGGLDFRRAHLINGDMAVAGKPIASAKPSKVDLLRSLSLERHRAADWLVGIGSGRWSEVSTWT